MSWIQDPIRKVARIFKPCIMGQLQQAVHFGLELGISSKPLSVSPELKTVYVVPFNSHFDMPGAIIENAPIPTSMFTKFTKELVETLSQKVTPAETEKSLTPKNPDVAEILRADDTNFFETLQKLLGYVESKREPDKTWSFEEVAEEFGIFAEDIQRVIKAESIGGNSTKAETDSLYRAEEVTRILYILHNEKIMTRSFSEIVRKHLDSLIKERAQKEQEAKVDPFVKTVN